MGEFNENSIEKNSILLSRNKAVALVVGAAGFLGSHLTDKLLEKGIEVVGVDNLEKGEKRNLQEASEDRSFHQVYDTSKKLTIELPRLDYLIILDDCDLDNILKYFKETRCRCLFVSSIDLYDHKNDSKELDWLKKAEGTIAKFAGEHNLNARILRLGSVYGPRMDFESSDPLVRLVQQALTGDLQKEIALEFSTRALYISDAVDLMIRTIFTGSTAQKIFDGVAAEPVKVAEVKQVLLDPVWYHERDFLPAPLPPWPTPNLDKTIKTLSWHPKAGLVESLKKTLSYFKDNEISVPKVPEEKEEVPEEKKIEAWDEEKRQELEAFKEEEPREKKTKKGTKIYLLIVLSLVTYALIWPALVLGWGIYTFKSSLSSGLASLEKGEFEKSLTSLNQAESSLGEAREIFESLEPVKKSGLLANQLETAERWMKASSLSLTSARSTALGVQALLQGFKAVTGELNDSSAGYFTTAQIELDLAGESLSKASAVLGDSQKLNQYMQLVSKARALSTLLPNFVAVEGSKSYLILLQNNMELRPTGGFIGSFAKVSFEGGKLKKLEVNDIYNIDGQLGIHVEPPKEIKEDLGQKDWFLRDSNWEPDFPTAARQAEWFYTKETGEKTEGVIALDVSAMEEILASIGGVDLPDYNEKITSDNLFEKAVSHAELSFFAGSQAKKSFLTALTNATFSKIFFSPQNNWPGIIAGIGKSLDEKHIGIYLNDPKLFSYIMSQNWAQIMPRQSDQKKDFLSIVEANLGANKVNYYLDKSYNLETVIGKEGEVKHRVRISFTNKSPSEAFPGGNYKNRMRIYLPFGSKITKVLWGETDITKNVSGFVDYGRSGYSLLLELAPKEQKNLVIDWNVPLKLEFEDGKASYRLDVIKQAGTLKDPFTWTVTYPISYQIISSKAKQLGPQEQSIVTDLSRDRSFEVEFSK
ncbi:DUF4012 domain-containing protein [Candidatus Daviesbacteria bacterium]|nr:DUF4012 domain-containing protein [Candidatus Daviesbacteria bacterium]